MPPFGAARHRYVDLGHRDVRVEAVRDVLRVPREALLDEPAGGVSHVTRLPSTNRASVAPA